MKYGIDVSAHQGKIKWDDVPVDFAILQAGYGKFISQKDKFFEENYKACKTLGIPVGAYWYSYALTPQDAVREAQTCLEAVKGKQFEYPIYFDIEEPSQLRLGKTKCSEIAKIFLDTVEKAGYWVGIYSSKSHLENYIDKSVRDRYAVWVAHYGVNQTNYNGQFGIWQKSDKGHSTGINGYVDINECTVDYPALIKKAGLNGFGKSEALPSPEPQKPKKGDKVNAKSVVLYASAYCKNGVTKTGDFWLYDGICLNGRYRITNSPQNCGKTPIGRYVTGWIVL